jgi:alkanesulfonate monooxygenase
VGSTEALTTAANLQSEIMPPQTPPPDIFWFVPGAGDGRHLGAATRPSSLAYLASIAQAADNLGFDGVLLPTGGLAEDTIVFASVLLSLTRHLRFLVAVRPGLISPILAARINASLDRISNGRANLNVVSGSGKFDFEGLPLSHEERYELTREWLAAFRGAFGSEAVTFKGKHIHIENGKALLPSVQRPYPAIYFGGSSAEALSVAAEHVDVYLSWGERPEEVAEKFADIRRQAQAHGRQVRFGLRAHIIVRPTEEEAWSDADRLIAHLTDEQIAKAQMGFAASESIGQQRMARLHHGSRESLRIGKNLWAGVGLVRGGAGTAFVGSPENIVQALAEYRDAGVETFILSGYPHLEEAYRTAELLFPALGKNCPIFASRQQVEPAAATEVGSTSIGRFSSI